MKQDNWQTTKEQVEIIQSEYESTRYAGAIALQRVWKWMKMPQIIEQAGLHYGQCEDKAADYLYALTLGPLVEADSVRKVAQRFGGEGSLEQPEADVLLCQQVAAGISQRTLARFVNCERHEWLNLHREVVKHLQKQTRTRMAADGVIVIDDMPIVKAHARKMDYLSTIFDSNHQRFERGYLMLHLYYYHPQAASYSIAGCLWHKRSLGGGCKPKPPQAYRPAKADEEQSKLDLALALLEPLMPLLPVKPTLVFDSWYCARWFVAALTELGFAWISQAGSQRKFEVEAGYLAVPELIAHYQPHLAPVPGLGPKVRAFALPALIRPDMYTRQAQPVQLLLVQDFFAKDKPGTIRLLLCNRRHWSIRRILLRFSYRTKIEETHRMGKQVAGWGDFHSRAWPTLQAHCAIALLRSLLLTLLSISKRALHSLSFYQLLYHVVRVPADIDCGPLRQLRLLLPRGQPTLAAALQ